MSEAYVGEIRPFAGQYAPANWVPCNGASLAIINYPQLFSLIGTTYGGDGIQHFCVPDLQGRLAVGTGVSAPSPLTRYNLGDKGGTETATVTLDQMPGHKHSFYASTDPATTITPDTTVSVANCGDNTYYLDISSLQSYETSKFAASAIGTSGVDGSHPNIQPTMALTYIICAVGLYPNFE